MKLIMSSYNQILEKKYLQCHYMDSITKDTQVKKKEMKILKV